METPGDTTPPTTPSFYYKKEQTGCKYPSFKNKKQENYFTSRWIFLSLLKRLQTTIWELLLLPANLQEYFPSNTPSLFTSSHSSQHRKRKLQTNSSKHPVINVIIELHSHLKTQLLHDCKETLMTYSAPLWEIPTNLPRAHHALSSNSACLPSRSSPTTPLLRVHALKSNQRERQHPYPHPSNPAFGFHDK